MNYATERLLAAANASLAAWEDEEESVREEHAEQIAELEAAIHYFVAHGSKEPEQAPGELIEEARSLWIDRARRTGDENDLEIDDNAKMSDGDGGTWVQAWVWVPIGELELTETIGDPLRELEPSEADRD
jgi:hypothetical protein